MKLLWRFESHIKFEQFTSILDDHNISYEVSPDKQNAKNRDEIELSVDEKDYEKAKRLLLKHRKRRTSSDLA